MFNEKRLYVYSPQTHDEISWAEEENEFISDGFAI